MSESLGFELIELHDAEIHQVVMCSTGDVVVAFGHVAVYERREQDKYDLVSYEAELVARGAANLSCPGLSAGGNVVSCWFLGDREIGSDVETQLTRTTSMMAGGKVSINLTTGATIGFNCDALGLRLGRRGKVFDTWEGPLEAAAPTDTP
jgi:hypothetical protein